MIPHAVWAVLGMVTLGIGALGVVLPVLPTTPLLLVAAFCFARSSERLNSWFKSTKLYREYLEGFVARRSMTLKAKLCILVPVTIIMAVGFAFMGRVPVGRVILAIVWVAHIVYFGFVVATDTGDAIPTTSTASAAPITSDFVSSGGLGVAPDVDADGVRVVACSPNEARRL